MTKTLIVPGLDGSPQPHWQDWWVKTDPNAVLVDLSNPSRPDPHAWEAELAGMILHHPDAVVVAHSLGAVLVARLLHKFPQVNLRAALLVAPAETPVCARINAFQPILERPLGIAATVVGSRNDPWMPFSRARQLADRFQADFVDLGFAGHVNVASGFGPWAYGKELRDELIWRSARKISAQGQRVTPFEHRI